MGEVMLRDATAADCGQIAQWIHGLAAHEGRPEAATVVGADIERWCLSEARVAEAFIVERTGSPVGYVILCAQFATFQGAPLGYLEDLFIAPSARGGGIGELVMGLLARLVVDRGWVGLDWSAVAGNAGAIRFYDRLGAARKDGLVSFRLVGADLARVAARG